MRDSLRLLPLALLGLLAACGRPAPPAEGPPAAGTCVDTPAATAGAEAGDTSLPPLVRTLEASPRRAAPTGTATVALLAQGRNAFLARLEMAPGASVPTHADRDEEYLFILEGRGELTIDDETYQVGPGTAVFMPAGATVTYRNGDARLVAMQVFAGPASAAKYDRWTPVDGGSVATADPG